MPIAKVLLKGEIGYQEGSFSLTQGVKQYYQDGPTAGGYFQNRGYGWGSYTESSKMTIAIDVAGQPHELWIDFFWKNHVGQLSDYIRKLIEDTIPNEIEVEAKKGRKGTAYFKAAESAMKDWLKRFWEKSLADANLTRVRQLAKRFLRKKKNYDQELGQFVEGLLQTALQDHDRDLDGEGFAMETEDQYREDDRFWRRYSRR